MKGAKQRTSQSYTKLIETEIRNYHMTQQELKQAAAQGTPAGMSAATRLYLERITHGIERAIVQTCAMKDGEQRLRLVELKYWQGGRTDEGIMMELCIGKTTFYRWKKEFIATVGENIGLTIV